MVGSKAVRIEALELPSARLVPLSFLGDLHRVISVGLTYGVSLGLRRDCDETHGLRPGQ